MRPELSCLRLSGAENGDIRWFNKSYTRRLFRDKAVRQYLDSVDLHSYCLPVPSFLPFKRLLNDRTAYIVRYRKWLDKHYPDMPVKMSEWTHMKGGRDKSMHSALVMARVMYEDIALLGVCSWQHWIAVSEVDYCDGLIYINLDEKTFETTKRLYVTGNFSKYLPDDAQRVDAHCDDKELCTLAFAGRTRTVVIIINDSGEEKSVSIDPPCGCSAFLAVTDRERDLEQSAIADCHKITLTAESVTSIVYDKQI